MAPLFEPKLLTILREGYTGRQLLGDVGAGVVVGIVAFPLAIAFAIASGVSPEQGVYTAIVAGLLISILGGSRVQIGGPTGAFIVLVVEILNRHGYEGLVVATMLAGGLLIAMGLARFGAVLRFVPYPVTVGFTAGIALIIAVGQVPEALGLELATNPPSMVARAVVYAKALHTASVGSIGLTLGTIVLLLGLPRFLRRVPASIVAIVAMTAVAHLLGLSVETIGSRFGEMRSGFPLPSLPSIDLGLIPQLIPSAVSIALLAGIESLLSAVVADGMIGGRHRPNTELIAMGIANLASATFGGLPATGAIARTATNVKSGGRTPVAGIVHAVVLAVILVAAGRWVGMIPLSVLAGILFVVAYHMSEARLVFRMVRGAPRGDVIVMFSTLALTALVDLTTGIQVGVVLAAFLFMRRMVDVTHVRALDPDDDGAELTADEISELRDVPADVEVFEVKGPFFFGATHKFTSALSSLRQKPRVLVLRMQNVFTIDATGLRALESLQATAERGGPRIILVGVPGASREAMARSGLLARIGSRNVVEDLRTALDRARPDDAGPQGHGHTTP